MWHCVCCLHDLYAGPLEQDDEDIGGREYETLDAALRDLLPEQDAASLAHWLEWRAGAYPGEQAEIVAAIARVQKCS